MFMVFDSPEPAYNFAFFAGCNLVASWFSQRKPHHLFRWWVFLQINDLMIHRLHRFNFTPVKLKQQVEHPWSWGWKLEVGSQPPFERCWPHFSCLDKLPFRVEVSSFLELGTSHTFHYQSLDPTSDSHGTWTWTPRSLFGIHIHANQSYIHRETLGWGPLNNQAHIHLTLRGIYWVYPYIHVGKSISIYTSTWLNHFPGLVIQINDTWLVRTNLTLLLICSSI